MLRFYANKSLSLILGIQEPFLFEGDKLIRMHRGYLKKEKTVGPLL